MTEFCTDQALLTAIMAKFSTGIGQRFENYVQSLEQAGALSDSEKRKNLGYMQPHFGIIYTPLTRARAQATAQS